MKKRNSKITNNAAPPQTPQPDSPYTTALQNAFSTANLVVLGLAIAYLCAVYAAKPVYHAKLSDVFDRIASQPNLQTALNDLTAVENVSLQEIPSDEDTINGLYFAPDSQQGNMLFLQKGGEIIPDAPQCGCYIFMGMLDGGSLVPCKLQQIGDEFGVTKDGLEGRFYSAGKLQRMQYIHSKIESYDLTGVVALAFSGKNVVVFDIFTFRIPEIRSWKRKAVRIKLLK